MGIDEARYQYTCIVIEGSRVMLMAWLNGLYSAMIIQYNDRFTKRPGGNRTYPVGSNL